MKTNTQPKYPVTDILYVGIDVSKDSNQVCLLNFNQAKLANTSFSNNLDGATKLKDLILKLVLKNNFKEIIVVLESTGIYSLHIANYLSSNEELISHEIAVFIVNPKSTANYSKVLSILDKNDPNDAYALADFARSGHTNTLNPFKGPQRLSLQRLTRHRKHIVELLVREKEYVLNNIFLKFSDYNNSNHDCRSFSDVFSKTSIEVLLKYDSPEKIANTKIEKLIDFIINAGKGRFSNPKEVAELLQKAARSSYRLDKVSYDAINISIASSFNLIKCYESEIEAIDIAISKLIAGLDCVNQIQSLLSIPGIGPVMAAGIFAEIGDINIFKSDDALAKFIGLTWKEKQSGDFKAEDTNLTKAGNSYLRYYIIESAGFVINNIPEYKDYYIRKCTEVTKHKHSRATVLTARKLVRLIYSLMSGSKLYKKDN